MSKRRRLPPMTHGDRGLMGASVRSFTVGSWVANQDSTGQAVAVAIAIETERHGDLVLRLKSPKAVDDMVQMLLRHKRDVWPEAS
jgi:subtilisin-like proprotein convertase family protein